MSKKEKQEVNPFGAFNILQGGIVPQEDNIEDDIETGDTALIKEDLPELEGEDNDDDSEAIKRGDEALKKVIEKQTKKVNPPPTNVQDSDEVIEDSETEAGEDSDDEGNGFKSAITALSDKGILEIDSEDIEDSEEGLEKAIDKTINARIEKKIAEKLGTEGLRLLEFVENGGNPKDFIDAYYNSGSWSDFEIDNEHSAEIALREKLRYTGEDPEDIDTIIEEYKENGTIIKHGSKAKDFLSKVEIAEKEKLVESKKREAEIAKENERKRFEEFKTNLLNKKEIAGFPVSTKQTQKLLDFMTVIDKKTGKTEYQKAVESNGDASYLMAYLAMNKFDISKLEKQVVSKASSKVASMIKNYTPTSREKLNSGSNNVETGGNNPFEAFRKI